MSKHTPGPWRFIANHPGCIPAFDIRDAEGMMVAYLGHTRTPGQAEANARLIAAAPDLLAACERLSFAALRRESTMGDPCNLIAAIEELREAAQQARDAITKATCDQ